MSQKSGMFLQPARLDAKKLRRLYAFMLRCRMLTQKLEDMATDGRLDCAFVPETGLEAILAGALIDLNGQDRIAPGLYAAAARLASREAVNAILPEPHGCSRARRSSKQIIPSTIEIPAQINIALGAAWVFRTQGHPNVCMALLPHQSMEQEALRCALDFSVEHKLPLVYVVQTREGDTIHPATPHLPVLVVDGDDVLAVYRVAQEAVRRARQGRGPALIGCQTRFCKQSAGPKTSRNEIVDPIIKLEAHLQQNRLWSADFPRRIRNAFERELDDATRSAERSRLRLLQGGRQRGPALAGIG